MELQYIICFRVLAFHSKHILVYYTTDLFAPQVFQQKFAFLTEKIAFFRGMCYDEKN